MNLLNRTTIHTAQDYKTPRSSSLHVFSVRFHAAHVRRPSTAEIVMTSVPARQTKDYVDAIQFLQKVFAEAKRNGSAVEVNFAGPAWDQGAATRVVLAIPDSRDTGGIPRKDTAADPATLIFACAVLECIAESPSCKRFEQLQNTRLRDFIDTLEKDGERIFRPAFIMTILKQFNEDFDLHAMFQVWFRTKRYVELSRDTNPKAARAFLTDLDIARTVFVKGYLATVSLVDSSDFGRQKEALIANLSQCLYDIIVAVVNNTAGVRDGAALSAARLVPVIDDIGNGGGPSDGSVDAVLRHVRERFRAFCSAIEPETRARRQAPRVTRVPVPVQTPPLMVVNGEIGLNVSTVGGASGNDSSNLERAVGNEAGPRGTAEEDLINDYLRRVMVRVANDIIPAQKLREDPTNSCVKDAIQIAKTAANDILGNGNVDALDSTAFLNPHVTAKNKGVVIQHWMDVDHGLPGRCFEDVMYQELSNQVAIGEHLCNRGRIPSSQNTPLPTEIVKNDVARVVFKKLCDAIAVNVSYMRLNHIDDESSPLASASTKQRCAAAAIERVKTWAEMLSTDDQPPREDLKRAIASTSKSRATSSV